MLVGLLNFLFWFFLISYILKFLGRFVFPVLLKRYVKKKQSQFNQQFNQHQNTNVEEEGKVTIKTKPKKSGMLKRQQQKRKKKMLRRRQAMPKRVSQQPGSSQQIEQLLRTLPTLAFEPELADLSMDKTELKTLLDSDSTEVDILMELLTEDFIADLDQRLARLEEANPEKSIKSVLSKATRHQIANSEKIPNLSRN